MKIKNNILAVVVAVLLGIGATSLVLVNLNNEPEVKQDTTLQVVDEQTPSDSISFTAEADKNVLEQLTAREAVETKDSQYGAYVDSINGRKSGEDGKYWTFYVDGQMAQVGAAEFVTKGGETVEWKFE